MVQHRRRRRHRRVGQQRLDQQRGRQAGLPHAARAGRRDRGRRRHGAGRGLPGRPRCRSCVVSRRGEVPEQLRGAQPGTVLMVTCARRRAPRRGPRRSSATTTCSCSATHRVDLAALRAALVERGWTRPPLRGRPAPAARPARRRGSPTSSACTLVPRLVGGDAPADHSTGPPVDVPLTLHTAPRGGRHPARPLAARR